MTFSESAICRAFVIAVLAVFTGFVATGTLQASMTKASPTGVQVAGTIPMNPFPPLPTGNANIASSIPMNPFPPLPTGNNVVSA